MRKKYLFAILILVMISAPLFAFAKPLVTCGLFSQDIKDTPVIEGMCTLCDLYVLAQTIVDFLMWQATPIIAIFALSWAGFKILISGPNPGLRNEGFGIMKKTLVGVLIVFSSWIVINEVLIFFSGTSTATDPKTGAKIGGVLSNPWNAVKCSLPAATVVAGDLAAQDQEVRAQFTKAGVTVSVWSSANTPCTSFDGPAGCTTLAQLPQNAITGIIALAQGCACTLQITGGTERVGHTTHGPGLPIIDISKSAALDAYILSIGGTPQSTTLGPLYTIGRSTYLDEIPVKNQGAHWHIVFA